MKERILKGWTFSRVLFLLIGALIVTESVWRVEWVGIVFGGYFAIMGLLGLGCASGNCAGGSCNYTPPKKLD